MNNNDLIKKLQNIYDNSTLGDIPEIIKTLQKYKPRIVVELTHDDMEELNEGVKFVWCFPDQNDNYIELVLGREEIK
jgi:hypothetical protein